MTYPEQHQYVSVIGDAYSAAERWQFGFRLRANPAAPQAVADQIAARVLEWWNGSAPYVLNTDAFKAPTTHRLTEVKVAPIDVNGEYVAGQSSASHFFSPAVAGGFAPVAGQLPQATFAVTLLTAKPRGYASHGRIYLPPTTLMATASDGKVSGTDAGIIGASIKRLINAINAETLVTNVAVFSRGKGVPSYNSAKNRIEYTYPNQGYVENVTSVGVGRLVDTQRRRRNRLVESRTDIAL